MSRAQMQQEIENRTRQGTVYFDAKTSRALADRIIAYDGRLVLVQGVRNDGTPSSWLDVLAGATARGGDEEPLDESKTCPPFPVCP